MLRPFTTVPHVVTPTVTLFSLLLHNCFAAVLDHNVNILETDGRSFQLVSTGGGCSPHPAVRALPDRRKSLKAHDLIK